MTSPTVTRASRDPSPLEQQQRDLRFALNDYWSSRLPGNHAQLLRRIAEQTFLYGPNEGRADRWLDLDFLLTGIGRDGKRRIPQPLNMTLRTAQRVVKDLKRWGLITVGRVLVPHEGFRYVYGLNVPLILSRPAGILYVSYNMRQPAALTAIMAEGCPPSWRRGARHHGGSSNYLSLTTETELQEIAVSRPDAGARERAFLKNEEGRFAPDAETPSAETFPGKDESENFGRPRLTENRPIVEARPGRWHLAPDEAWDSEHGCVVGPKPTLGLSQDALDGIADDWGLSLGGNDLDLCVWLVRDLIEHGRRRHDPDTLAPHLALDSTTPARLLVHIAKTLRDNHSLVQITDGLIGLNLDRWLDPPRLPGRDAHPDERTYDSADVQRWSEAWRPKFESRNGEPTDEGWVAVTLAVYAPHYPGVTTQGSNTLTERELLEDLKSEEPDWTARRVRLACMRLAERFPRVFSRNDQARYEHITINMDAWLAGPVDEAKRKSA